MTPFTLLLTALLLLPARSVAQPSPDSTHRLLLTNAHLVDPQARTVEHGAVRIEGARLDAVETGAEAGLPLPTGTNAGNPGVFQSYSLHRELVLLTQAGVSNWTALAAATGP